jgi:hypothetical protein
MHIFDLLVAKIQLQSVFHKRSSSDLRILVLTLVLHVFLKELHLLLLVRCGFAQVVLVLDESAVHDTFRSVLGHILHLQICARLEEQWEALQLLGLFKV